MTPRWRSQTWRRNSRHGDQGVAERRGRSHPDGCQATAICDEAHRHDLPVTAHARRRSGRAGMPGRDDELAHTPGIRLSDDVIETLRGTVADRVHVGYPLVRARTAIDYNCVGSTRPGHRDLRDRPGQRTHPRRSPHGVGAAAPRRRVGARGGLLHVMVRAPLDLDAPADLIALGRSPLDDPSAFDDLRLVVRAGGAVSPRPNWGCRPARDTVDTCRVGWTPEPVLEPGASDPINR